MNSVPIDLCSRRAVSFSKLRVELRKKKKKKATAVEERKKKEIEENETREEEGGEDGERLVERIDATRKFRGDFHEQAKK